MYYLGSTVLRLNSPFTIGGTQYPSNWLTVSTEADRAAIGITWVADPVRADDRFYWNGDATMPKALEDREEVDENGDPVLDADGVQLVSLGLKSQAIATVKAQAAGLLSPTDWYVTRKAETGTEIPSDVLTYRQSVRTASGAIEAAISGVTTLEAFIALYEAPVDAEGNVGTATINAWPEA